MLFVTVLVLTIIVSKFVFWRRLKDDFEPEAIFKVSFLSIGLALVLGFVTYKYYPEWWFWAGVLGVMIGSVVGVVRYKMYPIELAETTFISAMPIVFTIYTFLYTVTGNWDVIVMSGIALFCTILFVFFDRYYKRFSWYRSGRVGFAGLASAGVFFLARGIVAYLNPDMLSFVPGVDVFISSLFAVVPFAALFILARKS
ncbi:hypothetical protein ACFL2C_03565 [Patescibacteria group bacterium]